jgi:hypothetical protein
MSFADDWLGAFTSQAQLERAWEVWRSWELAAGCKLGVSGKDKTVVTGVRYDVRGRPLRVKDPRLSLRGGGHVPFMQHDEAYKHLGFARRADAEDGAMWASLRKKFNHALAKLRTLRVGRGALTHDEFVLVANALLGGLAGYYLQAAYITWEQAEEIEGAYRKIWNAKCGRAWSTARIGIYEPGFGDGTAGGRRFGGGTSGR